MTRPGWVSEAELLAELDARGFEPTDRLIHTARVWRKKGGSSPGGLTVPRPENGYYPAWIIQDLQRRIRAINDQMKPRLVSDAADN